MRHYFLNINDEEKKRIIDLHKKPYDGYQTLQTAPNLNELKTENLAQDTNGITLNNKNDVTHYKNHNINKNGN